MDFKETLNLPNTDFPMKANLLKKEPELLARWEKEDLYGNIRKHSSGKPQYVFHDGPPYANGHIHMGHALNKILKDFIVKFKTMSGFDAGFIPGWDCHGLPIEHQVTKEERIRARVKFVSFAGSMRLSLSIFSVRSSFVLGFLRTGPILI
jgi:isoleucyl-tRNA synthetase